MKGYFRSNIPGGTIIVYVNGKAINDPGDIDEALVVAQERRIQILPVAPDVSREAFNFSLGHDEKLSCNRKPTRQKM